MRDRARDEACGGRPAVREDIAPNLIPMIDIMFLLLLFLMLGADMGQRELEDVVLPAAGALEAQGCERSITTVNVYHRPEGPCADYQAGICCAERGHWRLGVYGVDYRATGLAALLGDRRPGKVMIRADRSARYERVQEVLETCARAGVYRVEIAAWVEGRA